MSHFDIDRSIQKRTTHCQHDFQCLNGKMSWPQCVAEGTEAGEYIFVQPMTGTARCTYAMPFGYSCLCRCPVRCEILRKYKV